MKPVMSVEEARKLLGEEADGMTDDEIERLVDDFDLMARYALQEARKQLRKDDAMKLANLTYDIYREEQQNSSTTPDNREK